MVTDRGLILLFPARLQEHSRLPREVGPAHFLSLLSFCPGESEATPVASSLGGNCDSTLCPQRKKWYKGLKLPVRLPSPASGRLLKPPSHTLCSCE